MTSHLFRPAIVAAALLSMAVVAAQAPDAAQVAQERAEAERDAPKLAKVLRLEPGMTVADIGAGGGAMSVVLGKWIGNGRVYATDIAARQLAEIRDYAKREGLTNVTLVEGAAASTNLPEACCEALFLRVLHGQRGAGRLGDFTDGGLGDLQVQLNELLDAFEGFVGETEEGLDIGALGGGDLFGGQHV